jgi:hypothetical protein
VAQGLGHVIQMSLQSVLRLYMGLFFSQLHFPFGLVTPTFRFLRLFISPVIEHFRREQREQQYSQRFAALPSRSLESMFSLTAALPSRIPGMRMCVCVCVR